MAHMITPEIMIGIYRISLTKFLPLNSLLTKMAADNPIMFCSSVLPKPYINVFTVDLQKTLSEKSER